MVDASFAFIAYKKYNKLRHFPGCPQVSIICDSVLAVLLVPGSSYFTSTPIASARVKISSPLQRSSWVESLRNKEWEQYCSRYVIYSKGIPNFYGRFPRE